MRSNTPPASVRRPLAALSAAVLACCLTFAPPARAAEGDAIVNGGFEYPGAAVLGLRAGSGFNGDDWGAVERKSGLMFRYDGGWKWKSIGQSFDASRFGWDSTETDGEDLSTIGQRRANEVELQIDIDGNMYAELCGSQPGTAVFQTVTTVPGAAYKVRVKHASLHGAHTDSMRVVLVAADGTRTTIPMTRLTSNGLDAAGETSETVATRTGNTDARDHAAWWETYEGDYVATSARTTFTFEQVKSNNQNTGNLIDDVSLTVAYPLTYDPNGATGDLPR